MYPDIQILADLHTHSISSGHHTTDTITDLARAAAARGLRLLGVTDHGPAMSGAPTSAYFRGLAGAPRTRFGVRLLYGAELNILDEQGNVDLPSDILSTLDYAAAGIHTPIFRTSAGTAAAADSVLSARIAPAVGSDPVTAAYLHAMENPFVRILVHCDDPRFPADHQALAEAAARTHTLLEINEASLVPGGYRGDGRSAARELLRWCAYYHHPIILGSDSHGSKGAGRMENCLQLLAECHFPPELVLNQEPERLERYLL